MAALDLGTMPRAPSTPRLDGLDPAAVASAYLERMDAHVGLVADAAFLSVRPCRQRGQVSQYVVDLVVWAQTGEADRREAALAMLSDWRRVLFLRPIDEQPPEHEPAIDATTELGLVFAAALARCKLEAGQPVPSIQLAALGGVDRSRIRQHVRAGELRRTSRAPKRGRAMDAPILAGDARRWLCERGVAGFEGVAA